MVRQLRLRLLSRASRVASTGILLGILLAGAAISPAVASTGVRPAAPEVTGTPWSAPTHPVDCRQSENQVSCSPTDPSEVKPQQCYLGVLVDGQRTTVCTTYEEHGTALQSAGGKLATVEFGCSLGDVVCLSFENGGRAMAIGTTAMMFAVASAMRFDTSTMLWDAAAAEWSFWSWAVLIVMFIAMVWAITAAVVSGDRSEVVGAIVRSFIAIPAVPITLWLTGHLLNSIDDLTWYVMNRDGPVELFATLQKVMWAGGSAAYFFGFVIHALLLISMLLLMLVFAFRNIVLAALIMVGPVAWMVFPVKGIGPQWLVRYVSAVVVLLLTGPLTIGFVTLIINGLARVSTIWDPQSWPLLVGLMLVAFAPFAIFGLFSFVGAVAADSVGSGASSHAGRTISRGAQTAIALPTRLGGSPAGTPSRGGGAPSRPGASPTPSGASVGGAAAPAGGRTSSPGHASRPGSPGSQGPRGGSPTAPAPNSRPAVSTAAPVAASTPAAAPGRRS